MLRKVMAGTGCLVLHACVAGVAAWAAPAPSPGLSAMEGTCGEVLQGTPSGGARKETLPPGGSWVAPGDSIRVTITWPAEGFADDALHKVLDCVTVNGQQAPELSREERKPGNDGLFEHGFAIPTDLKVGTEVCDRGMVSGRSADGPFRREKTNDVCLTVAGPDGTRGPDAAEDSELPPPPLKQPGVVLGEAPHPAPAVSPDPPLPPAAPEFPPTLARTGSTTRFLAAYAGLSLAVGGISVMFGGVRRRRPEKQQPGEGVGDDECPTLTEPKP